MPSLPAGTGSAAESRGSTAGSGGGAAGGSGAGPGARPRLGRARSLGLAGGVAVVLVPVVAFALAPDFDSNTLLLVNIMLYVALAQGVNVIYGFTGYLPFGYVGFFGAGAYGAYIAVAHLHAGALGAVLLGGATAVVVGVILSPLLRLRGAYFAIASLAAALALGSLVSNPALTSLTNGPYGAQLGSIYSANGSYYTAVALVGISIVVVVGLRRSWVGLALRAVRADREAAAMAGVNVVWLRTLAWLVSAALAGLAGAVYAWAVSVFYPDAVFATSTSLFAIVFALAGGVGTTLGPVVGAVALYYLYDAIGISQPQYFQLIYGALIVAVALFLPGGLASLVRLDLRRVLGRRASARHAPQGQSEGGADA
jgi:branched-chain amino acid transport system permease protein